MTPAPLDRLSQTARDVLKLNITEAYTRLVVTGAGNSDAHSLLQSLSPQNVLSQNPANQDDASGMLAGLWLWQDCLDGSHRISQGLQTTSAAMWHAIMHRREGDFFNSKYWYARCQNHPCLATIAAAAGDVINPFPADKQLLKLTMHGWNTDAFVDLVEGVCDSPEDPKYNLAVALQQLEWRVLFDYCTRSALGNI